MATAGDRHTNSAAITEYFKRVCDQAHLKVTHQRLRIYRELVEAEDHPSAETLFARLRPEMPTLSLDTVYRTLGTLERHGLIKRIKTVQSQARYEAKMNQHHHFICSSCGRIIDFEWPGFDHSEIPDEILRHGSVTERVVTFSGICRKCGKDPSASRDIGIT